MIKFLSPADQGFDRDNPALAERQARDLVADPHASLAAPASRRRMAWAILMSARGHYCRQLQMIRDQRDHGVPT